MAIETCTLFTCHRGPMSVKTQNENQHSVFLRHPIMVVDIVAYFSQQNQNNLLEKSVRFHFCVLFAQQISKKYNIKKKQWRKSLPKLTSESTKVESFCSIVCSLCLYKQFVHKGVLARRQNKDPIHIFCLLWLFSQIT